VAIVIVVVDDVLITHQICKKNSPFRFCIP
jgi:hypothetical protein